MEEGHPIENYIKPLDNRNFKPSTNDDDDEDLDINKKPVS